MLWCGMLLNRLGGTIFLLLGLDLTRERGLSAELTGLVISLYAAGGLLAGPLGGLLGLITSAAGPPCWWEPRAPGH